jgi:malonate transporter
LAEIFGMTFPMFGVILLGFIAGKSRSIAVEGLAWLNIFVIYIALPSLFFQMLSNTPIEKIASWEFILATTAATYVVFALSFAIGSVASNGNIPQSAIQGFAGSYGNIGFMGLGIAIAAFGPEAAVPVALIFCFENAMHFTIAPLMMAIASNDGKSWAGLMLSVLKNIFTHPFILATIAGIMAAAFHFQPPEPVNNLLTSLTGAAAPCSLFAIGVSIALRPSGRIPAAIPFLLSMKLVIHPIIVYFFVSWVGDFDRIWVYSAILLAALPTATNVFVIAQQNNAWVERASSMILFSTGLSVFTVTALLYMISNGMIPADYFPPG